MPLPVKGRCIGEDGGVRFVWPSNYTESALLPLSIRLVRTYNLWLGTFTVARSRAFIGTGTIDLGQLRQLELHPAASSIAFLSISSIFYIMDALQVVCRRRSGRLILGNKYPSSGFCFSVTLRSPLSSSILRGEPVTIYIGRGQIDHDLSMW